MEGSEMYDQALIKDTPKVEKPLAIGTDARNIAGYVIFSGIVSRLLIQALGIELTEAEMLDLFMVLTMIINVFSVLAKKVLDKYL